MNIDFLAKRQLICTTNWPIGLKQLNNIVLKYLIKIERKLQHFVQMVLDFEALTYFWGNNLPEQSWRFKLVYNFRPPSILQFYTWGSEFDVITTVHDWPTHESNIEKKGKNKKYIKVVFLAWVR